MTIITKAISEKKADKMEQPLVVDEIPSEDAKADPEGQYPKGDLAAHYLILRSRANRLNSMTTLCLFLTALLVMSIGIIGGVYIYRQYARAQMQRFRGWCSIPYDGANQQRLLTDSDMFKSLSKATEDEAMDAEETMDNNSRSYFKERFEIDLENENYEKIDVPDFRGGRQGRFIHDFNTNMTGIIDMDGHRCFVMPLNRQRVLPPRNLYDLVNKMYNGYYEVDTEVVRETMKVVTPAISDLSGLGTYIARECGELPTYKLEKFILNVNKRSLADATFAQFAGQSIFELDIMNLDEVRAYERGLYEELHK